jgi:hypothetical protein
MLQHALSIIALSAAAWVVCGNWWLGVLFIAKGKRSSLVPIAGGVLGCLGCLLSPYEILSRLWWVPLILDVGCVPELSLAATYVVISLIRGRRSSDEQR